MDGDHAETILLWMHTLLLTGILCTSFLIGVAIIYFQLEHKFDSIWTVWIPFFMTYGLCKAGLTLQRLYWWSNIWTGFLLLLSRQQFGIFKVRKTSQEPPTGTFETFLRVRSYHKPFKVYILPKFTHWRDYAHSLFWIPQVKLLVYLVYSRGTQPS